VAIAAPRLAAPPFPIHAPIRTRQARAAWEYPHSAREMIRRSDRRRPIAALNLVGTSRHPTIEDKNDARPRARKQRGGEERPEAMPVKGPADCPDE
jgi:hypothetical protein